MHYEDDPFAQPPSGASPDGAQEKGASVPPRHGPRGVAERGFGWGALLISALLAILSLAAGVWLTDFVSDLMAREGWLGWTAFGLVAIAGLAALALALRELAGLLRLRKLAGLRRRADEALRQDDRKLARRVLKELEALYQGRDDTRWALEQLARHRNSVLEARDTLTLADRELGEALDAKARATVAESAKRVSVLTALSPSPALDMMFVAYQSLAMLRRLAELYGGQPGFFGLMRLARRVITHIVVTGGIALTLDLAQDMISKRLVGMVAGRLGEGVFNGALTVRLGLAAIDVCRPLPHIETKPANARSILAELIATTQKAGQ